MCGPAHRPGAAAAAGLREQLDTVRRVLHVGGATPLDVAGLTLKADLWEREFGPLQVKVSTWAFAPGTEPL